MVSHGKIHEFFRPTAVKMLSMLALFALCVAFNQAVIGLISASPALAFLLAAPFYGFAPLISSPSSPLFLLLLLPVFIASLLLFYAAACAISLAIPPVKDARKDIILRNSALAVLLLYFAVTLSMGLAANQGPYESTVQVAAYQISVTKCKAAGGAVTVFVRNIGAKDLPESWQAQIYDASSEKPAGAIGVSGIKSGAYAASVPVSNSTPMSGTYYVEDAIFERTLFTC